MAELLIHSMSEFAPLVLSCMERAGVRNVAEIGAEFGGMSQRLADHCEQAGGTFTTVDPSPKDEFIRWAASCEHVRHVAAPSLEVMPELAGMDAWVIDGDHNYYTVRNELDLADELCRRDGKPLLAFMHDVSWPCARRDSYYCPERIPEAFRHAWSYDVGVTLDDSGCLPGRGFRGMGQFAWALHSGGPRNGVLTAIEDFLGEAHSDERPLGFAHVPAVFGLGVIFDMSAEWAEDVAQMLLPYHENELIASLELNRLRNYLAVIDWQDRMTAGRAA